jgi:ABC-2 type transport system permease protein
VLLAMVPTGSSLGGYGPAALVTYSWLTQGLMMTVYLFTWNDVAHRIRNGDISIDLVRPLDLQVAGLAGDYGRACYHALARGLPALLVGAAIFKLTFPRSVAQWAAFFVSVVVAIAASYAFRYLYNLIAFWLLDYRGVAVVSSLVLTFLSGFIIPAGLFPVWLRDLAYATPFPAMIQAPIDIFVGALPTDRIPPLLLLQVGWVVILMLAGRAVFATGVRRLVIQGG